MQIITAALQKGGTGKTTTVAALAQAAAIRGKKVLAIDLDPQGNLSFALGAAAGGSFDLLQGAEPKEVIQRTGQGIDVIAASWNLATITSGKGSARRLQAAIKPLRRKYNLIVIDTPATAGELQYNALQAATGLLLPLMADTYNIQSLYQITDTAQQIRKSNPELKILGYILTMYDQRSTIARQMGQALEQAAQQLNIPYLGAIRAAVAVKEAAALQKSLFEYAPKSKPATDYMAIYDKITKGR